MRPGIVRAYRPPGRGERRGVTRCELSRGRLLAAGVAAAALCACEGVGSEPVAPFGGDLATPLPYRDVIGLVRFTPDDEGVAPLVDAFVEGGEVVVIAAPAATVLRLVRDHDLVAPDAPMALVLLDASVHGAPAGFAWQGDAESFRRAALAEGLPMPAPDRVELPGIGQFDDEIDLALGSMRMGRLGLRPIDSAEPDLPRVAYRLIERDGLLLVLPARDGARNVLESLHATRWLDPEWGRDTCLRLELGALVGELKDDLRRRWLSSIQDFLWEQMQSNPLLEDDWRLYRSMRELFFDGVRGGLDFLESIEHVFVRFRAGDSERGSIDLYFKARDDGFFAGLLGLGVNRPVDELLAGAPSDSDVLLAGSCDPGVLPRIRSIWESTRTGLFEGRRARREERHRIYVDDELLGAEDGGEAHDDGASFLDSFSGRFWIAGSGLLPSFPSRDARPVSPADVDAAPDRPADPGEDEPGEGAPAFMPAARVFAELRDDETDRGLCHAVAEAFLPADRMRQLVLASILVYSAGRAPGGLIEVIGEDAGARSASELRRLAELARDPDGGGARVPWSRDSLPGEAFLALILGLASEPEPASLALTRDDGGVHARFLFRRG